MYDALASHWACACVQQRSAKFLLQSHCDSAKTDDGDVPFQVLFSRQLGPVPVGTDKEWLEGKVVMRTANSSQGKGRVKIAGPTPQAQTNITREKLAHVCEAIDPAEANGHRLCLMIERKTGAQAVVWKLKAEKCDLQLPKGTNETFLAQILPDLSRNLRARYWLAVQLAHSLVQLHETAWLDSKWTKHHISFLEAGPNRPNLERPYVTVHFPGAATVPCTIDLNQFHENASILSLGIVLIEMHTGRSIEDLMAPDNRRGSATVDGNALYRTAERVFGKIQYECSDNYKMAISACLNVPWKVAGQAVSLLDKATRHGVHRHIICPLEDYQDILWRNKPS